MMRTFNNGIGLIIVVAEKDMQDVMQQIEAMGEKAYHMGWIEERGKSSAVKLID
jgi:phosphoribosylformylglycinamidine cyclo-ligase